MLNFITIRPVGAEMFHADDRTDMTKLIVVFAILRKRQKKIEVHTDWLNKETSSNVAPKFVSQVRRSLAV